MREFYFSAFDYEIGWNLYSIDFQRLSYYASGMRRGVLDQNKGESLFTFQQFSDLRKYEPDIPNSLGEIIFENSKL